MTAIDDLRRNLGQVPKGTPVSVVIGHAGNDQVILVDAGPLYEELGPVKAPPLLWAMPLAPVEGNTYPPPTWTRSNWRGAPYTLGGKDSRHTGDDLDQPGETDRGEPCYAIRKGTVVWAGRIPEGSWGNLVVIRHQDNDDQTFYSRYGHLDAIRIDPGQGVVAGQWIGNVGRTGSERGAFQYSHLHFDITNPGDVTLEKNPTHWPWTDLAAIMRVYADPGTFLRERIAPKPAEGKWRKVEVTSAIGLKVRAAPGLSAAQIDTLPNGVALEVSEETVKVDSYDWAQRRAGGGYLAVKFTRPFDQAPAPTTPPPRPSLPAIGVNFVGYGSPNALYALSAMLRQRGKQIGLVRITNEWKACLSVDADLVIFRVKTAGEGRQEPSPMDFQGRRWTGKAWFDFWWPQLRQGQREPGKRIAYSFLNEVFDRARLEEWVRFNRELMDAATAAGITITVGNWAVGRFEAEDAPRLLPIVDQAIAQKHLVSFNTYWLTAHPETGAPLAPETSLRLFTYMVPLLKLRPAAQWVIEELGDGDDDASYRGIGLLAHAVDLYKQHIAIYPGGQGAALWALAGSGSGWQKSNIPEGDFEGLIAAL